MRILLALLLLIAAPVRATTHFVAIAYHDVVDRRDDRSDDAVTTDQLIEFFDWMKAEGWTAISVDAIEAAGRGGPPLPEKAILLTFDDGYRSFYERVYPLLLAYRYPAVLALVGSWMDAAPDGMVDYGGTAVPRSRFVTWSEVRRMQASGLVEIASHSHDLHRGVLANREGNLVPSARTWKFDPVSGRREDDRQHLARIRRDLAAASDRLLAETGRRPRVLVWPFGRHSGPAILAADQVGFRLALTLEPERADARTPMAIPRYYPTRDPALGEILANLRFDPPRAQTLRLACVDLGPLAIASDPVAADAALGRVIDTVRAAGANIVVLPAGPMVDGQLQAAWFPTAQLPVAADVLGRAARQIGTRAGVSVLVHMPGHDPLLAADIARIAPIDGLLLSGEGIAAPQPGPPPTIGDIRAARTATDGPAAKAMAAASAIDPRLTLMLLSDSPAIAGPPLYADQLLLSASASQPVALQAAGWLTPDRSGRVVLRLPPERKAIRSAQRAGATALAQCPWQPETAAPLAPDFSAASFPGRP